MKILALCCAMLFGLGLASETSQGKEALGRVADRFDPRPVRHVLLIGNSRTYWHQMPWTLRQIDDSTHPATRLDITTLAWGGASFEQNWESPKVRRALSRHWDQIILQPESRSESSDQLHESFWTYGGKLIQSGRSTGSPVALIINWGYGADLYSGDDESRRAHIDRLEGAERGLAADYGAQVVDTSAVWETVHAQTPSLQLYEDGNHPTANGSYLSALMLEGFLSQNGASRATYAPAGLGEQDANVIRTAVRDYYGG